MCGIHGIIIGKAKIKNAEDFLKDGFTAGSLRGKDSSGIAAVDVGSGISAYQKLPVPGSFFVEDKYAKLLIDGARETNTMFICHTRHATSGKVGLNEAHPFLINRSDNPRELLGVHNGTLQTWRTEKGATRFDVDSEWALDHIFTNGKDAFKDFRGAYCFVWWDSAEGDILNIALNDERPMHIAFLKGGGMAYASEAGMLYWLLKRNDVEIEGDVLKLAEHNWYKFDIAKPTEYTKEAVYEPVIYRPSNHNYNYHGTATRYAAGTMMDKVAELFAPLINKAKEKEEAKEQKKLLTKEEVEALSTFQLKGVKGVFSPWSKGADGELAGTFYPDDGDAFDAIIRNAATLTFNDTSYWDVTAIGAVVIEGVEDPVIICSKPKIKLAAGALH